MAGQGFHLAMNLLSHLTIFSLTVLALKARPKKRFEEKISSKYDWTLEPVRYHLLCKEKLRMLLRENLASIFQPQLKLLHKLSPL
jgi:hypothetical protein